MPAKEKQLSLFRVLAALAWADGTVSHEELNFLKDFAFKFNFTGEEWAKIEMYLEDAIAPREAEALIQDFVNRLGGRRERASIIGTLKGLMDADGATSPEEHVFLKRFIADLEETGPASVLTSRIRGLFRQTVFQPARTSRRSEELHEFLNNRILFKVRRKLEREQLSLETHPDELAYASVFGGLMAIVASAHTPLSEQELTVLRRHLTESAGFEQEAVELIMAVIEESAARGLDRFRLTREFYQRSSRQQRLQLLDCLFDIAGSDTDLAHAEVEEIRAIARGLKLNHKEFIQAKTEHLRHSSAGER